MSTEAKLAQMLSEMNESKRGGDAGKLVCETECTMARIRSYSDFLYILRIKPLQTVCYYGAGAFLLLTLSALFLPLLVGQTGIFYAEILAWIGADVILVTSYFVKIRSYSGLEARSGA